MNDRHELNLPRTLDSASVIKIHDDVLKEDGSLAGQNEEILAGILSRIDSRIFYEELSDPIDIAAWYGFAIARGHAFTDGNKRTAMISMDVYLDIVGININLTPIPEDLASLMEAIAENRVSQQELADWLRSNQIT